MKVYSIYRAFIFLFMILTITGCKGRSGSEELTTGGSPEKEWHMTDEPAAQHVGPAEEEAFRQAAYEGELEAVKSLFNSGVESNTTDQDGHTALMFAAFNGHSEVVLFLIEKGAEVDKRDFMDRTALLYGATGPFPETVKILLDKGAEPNVVDNNEHFSPLMHAASEGHLEVVRVLLEYGADSSLKDIDGDDAFSFARQAGHLQVADYLKNAG